MFNDCDSPHGGGAIAMLGGSPLVIGCRFESCYSPDGGALYCSGAAAEIRDCTFLDGLSGRGGGLHCAESAQPALFGCLFDNNSATQGGAIFGTASVLTIEGCTFTRNVSETGGGIHFCESEVRISNCTLAENSALTGAGVQCDGCLLAIDRTIIAFSPDGEAVAVYSTSADLNCCDLYGNDGGDWIGPISSQYGHDGNISLDPLFCDAPGNDWGLRQGSPCEPFSPENPGCDRVGAWPVGCQGSAVPDMIPDGIAARARLYLTAIHPVPSAGSVTMHYSLRAPAGPGSRLDVFDVSGRLVRSWPLAGQPPGDHLVRWDGTDRSGLRVSAGVYRARVADGAQKNERSLILVR